jgi:hypothetical protein
MAEVYIRAATDGEDPGVFRLEYEATGDDASTLYSLVSGMAINVSIDAGTMDIVADSYKDDGESTNTSPGYGIYPGSIQFDVDKQVTSYGDPVAPSADPGALGDLPGSACTVEAGALYDDDAVPSDAPLAAGTICKFEIDPGEETEVCVTLALESIHRKGIVMEDGSAPSGVTLVDVCVSFAAPGPDCWNVSPNQDAQCHGDSSGEGAVNSTDFLAFKDSWLKNYGDAAYNPCADSNRDGHVNSTDFLTFKDNWLTSPTPDCTPGGTWPPVI